MVGAHRDSGRQVLFCELVLVDSKYLCVSFINYVDVVHYYFNNDCGPLCCV